MSIHIQLPVAREVRGPGEVNRYNAEVDETTDKKNVHRIYYRIILEYSNHTVLLRNDDSVSNAGATDTENKKHRRVFFIRCTTIQSQRTLQCEL